jgi:excisionase family DNA binding protein
MARAKQRRQQDGALTITETSLPGGSVRTRKRTEITIETERIVVLSRRKVSVVSWCYECGLRIKMVTVDEAAAMAGLSSRTVYRWIEAEKIHSIETSERLLLVCPRSLMSASGMEGADIDQVRTAKEHKSLSRNEN